MTTPSEAPSPIVGASPDHESVIPPSELLPLPASPPQPSADARSAIVSADL